jgi:hypothetical protein
LVFAGLGGGASTLHYNDASHYANHGTLTAMDPPTDWVWVPELGRWALDVDGTNDYAVTTGTPIYTAPYTACAWVKSDNALLSANSYYFAQYDAATSKRMWALATNAGTDKYALAAGNSDGSAGNNPVPPVGVPALTTNWTHVAGIFYASETFDIFINGVKYTGAFAAGYYPRDLGATVAIGATSNGASFFDGQVADTLSWRRGLSDAEIQALADPSNVMLSGLILPPRRRLWAVPAAAPAGFKAAWLNKQNRVIGGGVI